MKKFHLTKNYAIINFDATICDSEVNIISSKSFEAVLIQYIRQLRTDHDPIMDKLKGIRVQLFHDAFQLLLIWNYQDVMKKNPYLDSLLKERDAFYHFTESFYDYWRKLERFGIIASQKAYAQNARTADLIQVSDQFNQRILYLYRTITQHILGREFLVFRQLPAGINANIMMVAHKFTNNETYQNLQNVGFITNMLTRPPFIVYTDSNTRSGLFQPINENPLSKISFNKLHYFVYPIKVGSLLAFVYVHRDFLHHGVALSNLFEPAAYEEFKDKKPDLLFIYGIREDEYDGKYLYDKKEDMYVGFVSRAEKNDYFGYMKKMLLTLHNISMIDHQMLPIHGAMVQIILNDNQMKHIAIIGDSGAGKSETLEALRTIGSKYIKDMKVVFDDMGVFFMKDEHIYAHGTEIGAFVRLDDLDSGYAYQEIDRAIFMNPNQVNGRIILPVSYYDFIMRDHQVDMVLYANNYEENTKGLRFFDDLDDALHVFRSGKRFAKGTTSEVGLVESYFANPFGPVQRMKDTEIILKNQFEMLFNQKVVVGEIYTQLAVVGKHMNGPVLAAKKLLEYITK
ncbi:MAG: phosphoenolpyruvate carboxykinase [Firmicutes bacterium]|nr:phosphoenolpyruvate carboxykinase [Bacillota bacterium]